MAGYSWRMGTRGSAPVTSAETVDKMESADGNRRAHGRALKRQLGDGRYDIVIGYTWRERIDGKFKIIRSGIIEEATRKWIDGEPYP